jgi:hypothetical protein
MITNASQMILFNKSPPVQFTRLKLILCHSRRNINKTAATDPAAVSPIAFRLKGKKTITAKALSSSKFPTTVSSTDVAINSGMTPKVTLIKIKNESSFCFVYQNIPFCLIQTFFYQI